MIDVWLQQHCVLPVVNCFPPSFASPSPSLSLAVLSGIASLETFLHSHMGRKPARSEYSHMLLWKTPLHWNDRFSKLKKKMRRENLYFLQASRVSFSLDLADCLFPLRYNSREQETLHLSYDGLVVLTKHTSRQNYCCCTQESWTAQACVSQKHCFIQRSASSFQ